MPDDKNKRTEMSAVEDIWDACKNKVDALELRRQQVAAIARELAHELDAEPGPNPGEWKLKCPHCHGITTISETQGQVFVPGGNVSCAAATLITRRLRERLVNEGLR